MARKFDTAEKRLEGVNLTRLCEAIYQARMALRRPREERVAAVRQYVGLHWSEEGTRTSVPLNLISLYCKIVSRALVAKNPRVMLSTMDPAARAAVDAMEQWCNEEIERMDVAQTLKRVVLDALFSIGICKVALASPADAASVGWTQTVGQPFCERVDLDDFVFDVHARDLREAGFIGHRVRVPLHVVHAAKYYSKSREQVQASDDRFYNAEGDERINVLGRTFYGSESQEWQDYADLWEIYLPEQKVVLTLQDMWMTGPQANVGGEYVPHILSVKEWIGPDSGPYHFIRLQDVPGNAMSKAPVQDLIDLHEAINNIYRKLIRQAQRFKELGLVSGGNTEDADRIVKANDGEMIRVDNPQAATAMGWGGPNAAIFQLAVHLVQQFSYMAGNLDSIGGLSPQARTASQDQMLEQNASSGVADMQDTVLKAVSGILRAMCWYWYHHPQMSMRVKHQLPGMADLSITRTVNPADRQKARWDDLHLQVDPYSLSTKTPQQVVTELNQLVANVIIPMMPILQQQGVMFDINEFLDQLAKYMNLNELKQIMSITSPPDPGNPSGPAGGSQATPMRPAETTRNYVRRSLGNDSTQGKGADLMKSLAGQAAAGNSNGKLSPAQSGR